MKTLNNWNDWCNDKIVLTTEEDKTLLVNLNTIKHLEEALDGCTLVYCTEGECFVVKENVEDILGIVKEVVEETEARHKAAAEAQRKQYEEMYKQQQTTSEG